MVAFYPFRGNYDGGDYNISNLTIGSEEIAADQMTSGLFGVTSGTLTGNAEPTDEDQVVTIKNVHLTDVNMNIYTRYETYTGALKGNASMEFMWTIVPQRAKSSWKPLRALPAPADL